jgi:hypothetical protein
MVFAGDLDGFAEAKTVDPEGQEGFDGTYEQDGCDSFHVHERLLLDASGWQNWESEKQGKATAERRIARASKLRLANRTSLI